MEDGRVRPLRLIRVDRDPDVPLPLFSTLKTGDTIGSARILFAKPPQGMLVPSTVVEVAEAVRMKVERLSRNTVITVEKSRGEKEIYVYPTSLWEQVEAKYIEPLSRGEPPVNPGVLFTGPPGTGKSTMINLLSMSYGLVTHVVDPSLLRPYIGETERNIVNVFKGARGSEPSIIVMDECEWLLQARKRAELSGMAASLSSVVTLLLVEMQKWKNEGALVLVAAATNVPESELDPAFLRAGRFGKPLFVPPPDLEAAYEFLVRKGVPEADAAKLARQAVNAGLSMADIAEVIEMYKRGKPLRLEERKQRGYRRLVPPPLPPNVKLKEKLAKQLPPNLLLAPRARVEVTGRFAETVALPIVAYYLLELGKPFIEFSDERYENEAYNTAEVSGAVLLVRSDYITDLCLAHAYLVCPTPMILFGTRRRLQSSFWIEDIKVLAALRNDFRLLFQLIARFYGVDDKGVEEALKLSDDLKAKLLQLLPHFSGSIDEAAVYMANWH